MIYVIGISIAFFLSFLLITKKGRTSADTFLAFWMGVTGVHLFLFYNNSITKTYLYPNLLGLEIPLPLQHGPFLYLYTTSLTHPSRLKNYRWMVHFVPSLLVYFYLTPFFTSPPSQKIAVYENEGQGYQGFMSILLVFISIAGVLYVFFSNRQLRRYKLRLLNQFSYQEKINLNWLRYLFLWMGLLWLAIILRGNDQIIFTTVVFFVLFIGYFGIRQVGLFSVHTSEVAEKITTFTANENAKKYEKSGLSDEMAEHIYARLTETMKGKKIFTNPELSLADLALHLGVHPNYLSQVINTFEEKSFFDYINALRIEEFKRLADQPENQKYTLLGLAYDCGFNSKTSFNRNFKKATGLAPSDYLKQTETTLA